MSHRWVGKLEKHGSRDKDNSWWVCGVVVRRGKGGVWGERGGVGVRACGGAVRGACVCVCVIR